MTTLIKPLITEKSMRDAARGVYTFQVTLTSTKHQVKQEVENLFSVNVTQVNTRTTKQATHRTGRRRLLSSQTPKKFASVSLKQGQTIPLFDLKEDN